MNTLNLYIKNWKALVKRDTFSISYIYSAVKYFISWRRSLKKEFWSGPIDDRMPWMTFSAIDYLKNKINKGNKVFEYGSGGSTLFFLDKGCEVYSVENNLDWYVKIREVCESCEMFKYYYKKCTKTNKIEQDEWADYNEYYSSNNLFCKEYVETIGVFPDHYFDFVIIDGRARPACIKASKKKVKQGGYIIVDNTERDHYHKAIKEILGDCNRLRFKGPVPYLRHFTETSIFRLKTS